MKLTIDAAMCTGHGRCYTLAPDLLTYDDEGFVNERGTTIEVPPGRRSPLGGGVELPRGRHHDRWLSSAPRGHEVEVAPVRAGEDLDWPRLDAYLREQHRRPRRAVQRPAVPERLGQPDVPRPHRRHRARRAPAAVRPPRSRRPRHAPGVPRRRRAVASTSTEPPTPTCSATTTTSSARTSSSSSTAAASWCGTTCRPSMAHHDDAARRIGFAVVDALADLHLLDPVAVGLGDLGRPDGFVERQVSGWRKRWDLVDTGRVPQMVAVGDRLAETMPAVATAGLGAAQRLQDRQLPVRSGRSRSGQVASSTGTWPRSASRSSTSACCSTTGPIRPTSTAPARCTCRASSGWACPPRAEVVARYAERTGIDVVGRPLVRGVRDVEDVRRPRAAVPALRARREHRPADGRARQAGRPAERTPPRCSSTASGDRPSLPLDDLVDVAVPVRSVDRRQAVDVGEHRLARRAASPAITAAATAAWSSSISWRSSNGSMRKMTWVRMMSPTRRSPAPGPGCRRGR